MKLKMQGPRNLDVDVLIVCFFIEIQRWNNSAQFDYEEFFWIWIFNDY
jgi:hypothetical protein